MGKYRTKVALKRGFIKDVNTAVNGAELCMCIAGCFGVYRSVVYWKCLTVRLIGNICGYSHLEMSSEFGWYDRTMDLNLKASFIVLIGICLFRPAPGQNNQCSSNGVAYQVRPDADVKFSVILTLRPSTDGQTCGASISPEALQNLAVLEWTVNRLNEGNFVDGVTLGQYRQNNATFPATADKREH